MGERSDELLTWKVDGERRATRRRDLDDHCCRVYQSCCNYHNGLDLRVLQVDLDLPCRPRLYT